MLQSQCTFEPESFLRVMQNLIKNPNIMSTHLFRADILYDSQKDSSILTQPGTDEFSDFTKHLKKECQPIYAPIPGYQWEQTYVRQLVPRNRQLDKDLMQTCHFYVKRSEDSVSNLIVYIPHVTNAAEMPWYHPKVKQVAFLHNSKRPIGGSVECLGDVSVHFCRFSEVPLDQRLERTALQLLMKIHKHSRGQQAGYVKRVHHDQIVPQQRFQETYARLKAKYAKSIIDGWVEDTDPSKHVFEDLGIAAFLIELWADMYDCTSTNHGAPPDPTPDEQPSKPKFPGFVDIGCGNGLLIDLLNLEGYAGWGFDARARKTWQTFKPDIREVVKEMVLVPEVFHSEDQDLTIEDHAFHSGNFRHEGGAEPPFIISNHADELTPWTPLIAYLNGTSFIAIPCCSHNLSGAKFRAPAPKQYKETCHIKDDKINAQDIPNDGLRAQQAAETGSLKKSPAAKKQPSAYASLCDYVSSLGNEVGYKIQKEMLRIPSTRNACLLGRFTKQSDVQGASISLPNKQDHVREIVARELGTSLAVVRDEWILRAKMIAGKKGDGH